MNKYIKFILKTISTLIVLGAIALAILMVGIKLLGFQIYTVISGSMEPNYHVGSLIYVKQVNPSTLKKNDTITFKLGTDTIATHRIIEIVYDEDTTKYSFRTKGDANDNPDANLVPQDKILGKTMYTVPYLGYLATYIQNYPGNIVAICIALFLILVVIIIDIATEEEKKGKNNTKEDPKKAVTKKEIKTKKATNK